MPVDIKKGISRVFIHLSMCMYIISRLTYLLSSMNYYLVIFGTHLLLCYGQLYYYMYFNLVRCKQIV